MAGHMDGPSPEGHVCVCVVPGCLEIARQRERAGGGREQAEAAVWCNLTRNSNYNRKNKKSAVVNLQWKRASCNHELQRPREPWYSNNSNNTLFTIAATETTTS